MPAAAAAAVVAAAAAVPAAEAGDAALGLAFHRKPAALWKLQTQLGWDPWSPSAPLQFGCKRFFFNEPFFLKNRVHLTNPESLYNAAVQS